jgi:hypothetical protein
MFTLLTSHISGQTPLVSMGIQEEILTSLIVIIVPLI